MNRLEQSNMIQTIVKGYMNDINNPKTQAEIRDILVNHFYTMLTDPSHISQTYVEEEFAIWSNK